MDEHHLTGRAEKHGDKQAPRPPTPPACYSIASFCEAHHLSESMFFKLRREGLTPIEIKVGRRTLISMEAAAAWRKAREAASVTTAA
jgi:hypothetical protein